MADRTDQAWLTILGVGDNGLDSLSAQARRLFDEAHHLIAPARVLDAIDDDLLKDKEVVPWTFGVQDTINLIKERRGTSTTILATGDPMHFGIGATLRRYFDAVEMQVIPSPSGFSLAAAKLGWALQDCALISMHGRAVSALHQHLAPGRKIISLTSNARTIREAANLLVERQYGASQVTVLEHIGGADERISVMRADEIDIETFTCADFNMLAIECVADPSAVILPNIAGLPDAAFQHDGQLTKREIRAVTLAYLSPVPHQLLWDIGAGCGSVAIEWMRAAHGASAIAIEQDEARCQMIKANRMQLGVPKLEIVQGSAPDALEALQAPDAIFIGGGLTTDGLFEAGWRALAEGGRMVVNAVTVESEAKLIALRAQYGGDLTRMQVSRAAPVGRYEGWKPFMPVTIWSTLKGFEDAR